MNTIFYLNPIYILLAKLFGFASVFLLVLGIRFYFSAKKKTNDIAEYISRWPLVFRLFPNEIALFREMFGKELASVNGKHNEKKQKELSIAAIRGLTLGDVYGAQFFCALSLACIGGVVISFLPLPMTYMLIVLAFGIIIGWLIPCVEVQNIGQERQQRMAKELPFTLDVVTSAMGGGVAFEAAIRHYVELKSKVDSEIENPLRTEFDIALMEMGQGGSKGRIEALRNMSDRIQLPEYQSVVNAIAQGTQMGSSLCDILRIQAEEMRRMRMNNADKQAQRLPSLMLMPMLFFIFPSAFIIMMTPIFLRVQAMGILQRFGIGL